MTIKVTFASVDDAISERRRITPEIQRLQNWLSGVSTDATGNRISSHDYHNRRAEVIHRLTQLQQRAGYIREWLRDNAPASIGVYHPNLVLLARCHQQLVQRDEEPEVEALLRDIEKMVPMALLEGL